MDRRDPGSRRGSSPSRAAEDAAPRASSVVAFKRCQAPPAAAGPERHRHDRWRQRRPPRPPNTAATVLRQPTVARGVFACQRRESADRPGPAAARPSVSLIRLERRPGLPRPLQRDRRRRLELLREQRHRSSSSSHRNRRSARSWRPGGAVAVAPLAPAPRSRLRPAGAAPSPRSGTARSGLAQRRSDRRRGSGDVLAAPRGRRENPAWTNSSAGRAVPRRGRPSRAAPARDARPARADGRDRREQPERPSATPAAGRAGAFHLLVETPGRPRDRVVPEERPLRDRVEHVGEQPVGRDGGPEASAPA